MESIFLKSVTLSKKIHSLKKNLKIEFNSPLTYITGDQGTGKSTLLGLIHNVDKSCIFDFNSLVRTFLFDSEFNNPRILDSRMIKQDEAVYHLQSKFRSHGESLMPLYESMIESVVDCLVLLDEPESGISIKNQIKMKSLFSKLATKNQVIISTHSYLLLEGNDVYDMKTKKYIPFEKYLKEQL